MRSFSPELIAALRSQGFALRQHNTFVQEDDESGIARSLILEPQKKSLRGEAQVSAGIRIPLVEQIAALVLHRLGLAWVGDAMLTEGGGYLLAKSFGTTPAATLRLDSPIIWFDGATTTLNDVIALLAAVDSLVRINAICSAPESPWSTWYFRGAQNVVRRLAVAELLLSSGKLSSDASTFAILEREFISNDERHYAAAFRSVSFEGLRAIVRESVALR